MKSLLVLLLVLVCAACSGSTDTGEADAAVKSGPESCLTTSQCSRPANAGDCERVTCVKNLCVSDVAEDGPYVNQFTKSDVICNGGQSERELCATENPCSVDALNDAGICVKHPLTHEEDCFPTADVTVGKCSAGVCR